MLLSDLPEAEVRIVISMSGIVSQNLPQLTCLTKTKLCKNPKIDGELGYHDMAACGAPIFKQSNGKQSFRWAAQLPLMMKKPLNRRSGHRNGR